jgi:hypothetical protein
VRFERALEVSQPGGRIDGVDLIREDARGPAVELISGRYTVATALVDVIATVTSDVAN